MNKFMMIAGVAAVASLASCSNNETVEQPKGMPIGFTSMIDKNQSRAAEEATKDNLKEFKLWGWANNGLIFDTQVVKNESGSCTYEPLQYWEAKNYAFTALGSTFKNGETTSNACTAVYTVGTQLDDQSKGFGTFAFNNQNAKGNEDVVYAYNTKNVTETELTSTISAVPLQFNHALARVKFTFTNAMTEAYTIKITDVQIDNADASGTFDVASAKWNNENEFALTFDDLANTLVFSPAENSNEVTTDNTGYQYILPTEKDLTVTFKLTQYVNKVPTVYTLTATLTLPETSTSYLAGHSYNFNTSISAENLGLKPIVFTADVTKWDADEKSNVDVTIETPSVE